MAEPSLQEQFDAALAELPAKQRKFVLEYLHDMHGQNAAIRAGYSEKTARQQASRMLTFVNIAAAVQAGMALGAMPAPEVIYRLTEHARGDASDFLTILVSPLHDDLTGKPILDRDGNGIVRYFPSLDLEKARQRGKLHLIKSVRYTQHGPAVDLYDAQAALALLAKHHSLLIDRTEVTGKGGAPITIVSAADLATAREQAAQWEAEQFGDG